MSFPVYNYDKSTELFNRATKVIPSGIYGHLGPAEGQFIPVSKWPMFAEKAKGTYIWDVDGNKFIDYMCAYGPNVLGYCDPDADSGFFWGGRCSRTSGWTPEARSRICVCRASFLMTFVQSGMPPRLPAQDQCMLSHDISACSAT